MTNITRNFISGRMNKIVDERLLPDGEYIDAMNIRMGSTENSEVGVISNTKGNLPLTSLAYINGTPLSVNARCIGAIDDSANETIYWFMHDPSFTVGATGKLDMIVSYNVSTNILRYHIISINSGDGVTTTLNFNPSYLITGIDIVQDLLFFTDSYNQPRFININKNYANPVGNIDQFSAESILVIKKPPTQSPSVQLIATSGQENYLQDRFICFAYRYEYENGEYSATSQWSDIAFSPNPFEFSSNSMLNEGMTNFANTAIVTYNSGGPLVVGIDLLFKQSNNNTIKVIRKINKSEDGLADNTNYQFTFNNSKIFTILSEAEILRLYDNVPRFAKAQTIMGNRLMYGNYTEGYDLKDINGKLTKIEYATSLVSEAIGQSNIIDATANGTYNIDPDATGETIAAAVATFDFTGVSLVAGSSITINMTITHSEFTGDLPFPTETTGFIDLDFVFNLTTNYSSVYALATSPEFAQAIGTISNIKPVYSATPGAQTSCDGTTLTDQVNCLLLNNLDTLTKYGSGINAILEPIKIISTPASNIIGLQIPAMEYVDSLTTPTKRVYEYYTFTFAEAIFQKIGNPRSLHSNRGYEIGIVYMDEFNRSTTALVSSNNAVYVPCGSSASKNSIKVTIPVTQRAPSWAKRYKFVIKPDEENYETIYSNIFFTDPDSNDVWFLLEGENMQKVENGDRLIVKADTSGPTKTCVYTTVLDKQAQAADFITPKEDVSVLAGLYIKLNPNSFNLVVDPNAIISPGNFTPLVYAGVGDHSCPQGQYPMNIAGTDPAHPTWTYVDYSIPAGSRVKMYIKGNRSGVGGSCEQLTAIWEAEYVSSRDYDNMYDWFNGDNIAATLDNPAISVAGETTIEYVPGFGSPGCDFNTIYLQFERDAVTNRLWLNVSTGWACTGAGADSRRFFVDMEMVVYRALNTIIWETEPQDALPDVFFENNLSFAIDSLGNHSGNIQNQNIASGLPAVIDTGFFNCFSFGNGAESYKIRDSIIAKSFNLGERVTSVSSQDYRRADRFADITYSGNYNLESNVNRLNEFNKGLSNYKNCEFSFGPIQVLDGRETDVLTLQEDKISYVLAGKNLLSDASAGNIVTATPEVLGTQISRTEKYGISFNPESYVQWGYDRYFTDAKRGAVIQIKGDSSQTDQLVVISEQNMRTWFRDMFNESFNTQKLGGFDPYMNEYVLSNNNISLPVNAQCTNCGISQTFTLSIDQETSKEISYCIDLGPLVGLTDVNWDFTSIDPSATLNVSVEYNGITTSSGPISSNGSVSFDKNSISEETAVITLEYTGDMVVSVLADCCQVETMNIVEVVVTNNSEADKTIHTQYRYQDGTFIGPLLSNLVVFGTGSATPLVSRYNITSGFVGSGGFSPELSTMRLSTNKISPDDYDFDIAQDKFKYLRTNTLYNNNDTDIQALLLASSTATPNSGTTPLYYADFSVPLSSNGQYLYLIWDLRDSLLTELCFSANVNDACCDCTTGNYYLNASFANSTSIFTNSSMTVYAANGFYSSAGIVRELVDGVLLPQQACGTCGVEVSLCFGTSAIDVCCSCNDTCTTNYNGYSMQNDNSFAVNVKYYNADGILQTDSLTASETGYYCSIGTPYSDDGNLTLLSFTCDCIL